MNAPLVTSAPPGRARIVIVVIAAGVVLLAAIARPGRASPPLPKCIEASSMCQAIPRAVLVGRLVSSAEVRAMPSRAAEWDVVDTEVTVHDLIVEEVLRPPGSQVSTPAVGATVRVERTSLPDGPVVAVLHPEFSSDVVTVVGRLVDGGIVHDKQMGLSVPRDAALQALLLDFSSCRAELDALSAVDCSPRSGSVLGCTVDRSLWSQRG